MIQQKKEFVLWCIISLVMLIITITHPRIIYGIMVIVCGIYSILCYRSTRKKTLGKICIDMIGNVLSIVMICYIGQCLNIIFPYHASYEYKKDIASLKTDDLQEYSHFPDNIPEFASDVEWVCFPSMLQGSGYHRLFFYADTSYLQEIYDTYAEYATIYTYDQYAWTNHDMEKSITFPEGSSIEEQDRNDVKVLMLYDNQDVNHSHNGGIYINKVEGYIGFFAQ